MKRLLSIAAILLAIVCLLVWASPSRSWDGGRGPWVYYPFGYDERGVGLGISAWILATAWSIALGTVAGLLSSIRVSRAWFAIALPGLLVLLYGTLFGFLESFHLEPQGPWVPGHRFFGYTDTLPLGLAVGVGGMLLGVIGTRAMLHRSERRHMRAA